jgi:hypothetical protein
LQPGYQQAIRTWASHQPGKAHCPETARGKFSKHKIGIKTFYDLNFNIATFSAMQFRTKRENDN